MKTYCTEEMVGLECSEWVPADVARELFEALKHLSDDISDPLDVASSKWIRNKAKMVIKKSRGES